MFRFRPLPTIIILIGLITALHLYQVKNNPCYRVLRLHVIANSDRPCDQAVKLKVRDEILRQAGAGFRSARTPEEACGLARQNLPGLEEAARRVISSEGFDYQVRAEVGRYSFPTRFYGHRVFPAGEYTAVRVVLGQGQGRNWWCVLFPPLCPGTVGPPERQVTLKLKSLEMLRQGRERLVGRASRR